ncbi:PREDICTED: orphan sodium- and chloride-dependent neurotransmitter transporter NTT5-like [Chinchilla lanigera]|uniref:orphan sodium- and chloride-dependent neurotransmitter transporter NTT5-like n=1 Tax=Chinchilla lanigera TaxID=34839 RepID=UPI00038EBC45|nr:PREDICTED: orphan sodium- and chloride-dependent neurotransmitter transporter NTT5-like [Chinchilla lanigera]XP_005412954.1 PREDICTED: orphan sodium- and chloride-dependent neurotransmitter transporter NTT5-like [Chinchilla lanigera]XP_005412955.1 PREDICTED: orphan sodium- and chloride-dependent neurotransmitter transporter NTT5-like [Chinchilla lanigera]
MESILLRLFISAGFCNLWRFPYLCHQNGGGGFLLTYVFILLLFGIPLLYMEMVLGQRLRADNIRVWKQLVPWLGGLGYACVLVRILVSTYNSVIISWSLFYLGSSFTSPLPWEHCPLVKNASVTDFSCLRTVPHQYFLYHTTLQASGHMEEGITNLVLNLSLGSFTTWVVVFFVLILEIKISVLVLASWVLLSYILLFFLFVRGLFLEGALSSLRRLMTIELSTLASVDLWWQAGGHVLYSLGLGMGTITTFFSHNSGGDSYVKMASFVALINLVTSMLATSTIFIVMGFWVTTSGHSCVEKAAATLIRLISNGLLPEEAQPPEDMVHMAPQDYLDWIISLPKELQGDIIYFSPSCSLLVQKEEFLQGPGLAYAAFSQAVSLFPDASFWAIILFLTMLVIGLGTSIRLLEDIVPSFQNSTSLFISHPRLIPALVCLGGFLGSLVFTSQPGSYVLSLFDDYLVPQNLIILVIFQNGALIWIYGARRFKQEVFSQQVGLLQPSWAFLCHYVTLPGLLVLLTVCLLHLYFQPAAYYFSWNSSTSQEVRQPYLQSSLSWAALLAFLTLLPVPAYALHHWWCLENKRPTAVAKAKEWLKRPGRKTNLSSQHKARKTWLKRLSLPWFRLLRPSLRGDSKLSSHFTMPQAISPFSMNVTPSQQTSPSSGPKDSAGGREEKTEKLPDNSGK